MLVDCAVAAVAACDAERLAVAWASQRLPQPKPWHLFGAGKAAVAMARGLVASLGAPASGLLVAKEAADSDVRLLLGGHPVPTRASVRACRAMEAALAAVPPGERSIFVLSGGASSLLSAPIAGLTLPRLQQLVLSLLSSGQSIHAINRVRRMILRAAGGGLAGFCKGPVEVVVLSDVLGNDWATIGSGPFMPPTAWSHEPLPAELRDLRLPVPPPATAFQQIEHHLVGDWHRLQACAIAELQGQRKVCLWPQEAGDVHEVASRYSARLGELLPGEVAVGGGEPTVTLPASPGRGGRNMQLALCMAKRLAAGPPARFVAVASDGDDGNSNCAGAIVDHTTWSRLGAIGVDPERALCQANAYVALAAAGAQIHLPKGRTNVLDLHLLERLK